MNESQFIAELSVLVKGQSSSRIKEIFAFIMTGAADPIHIAAFLTALHMRGETAEDITAAAEIMRQHMTPIDAPKDAPKNMIDLCGTGGDMKGTLNISTAAALVAAACGVPVAKHGNRAQSSQSGSADILESLGVKLDPANNARALREIGIGFLFAQHHHRAMKYVAEARRKLGFRTIFNLIGPLCNPASVRRQLIGVFDKKWLLPLAHALERLGCDHAWVVHGDDGLDELTTTTISHVVEVKQGRIRSFEIDPAALGIPRASMAALKGGSADDNRRAFQALLDGKAGAYRDIVLLNSAAALIIAGKADDLETGMALAERGLDERAAHLLDQWVKLSNA